LAAFSGNKPATSWTNLVLYSRPRKFLWVIFRYVQ